MRGTKGHQGGLHTGAEMGPASPKEKASSWGWIMVRASCVLSLFQVQPEVGRLIGTAAKHLQQIECEKSMLEDFSGGALLTSDFTVAL